MLKDGHTWSERKMYSHLKNVGLGPLCKHGHDHGGEKSWRHIANWTCVECQRARIAKWSKTTAGMESLRNRKIKHRPKRVVTDRNYRQVTASHRNAYNATYRAQNKDWLLTYYRDYNARKKASLRRAIPGWADLTAIKEIYKRAHEMTNLTGVQHDVDHIVPLISKRVCGLHVQDNLRVITEHENCVKGNRWWPESNGYQDRLAFLERAKAAIG